MVMAPLAAVLRVLMLFVGKTLFSEKRILLDKDDLKSKREY